MRNQHWRILWLSVCLIGFGTSQPPLLLAQSQTAAETNADDEPIEVPGLLGSYTAGGRTILRREADIAFVWGKDAPDQRLPAGAFRAVWTGKILVRSPGKYRFHAHLQGKVEAKIGGRVVLSSRSDQLAWVSGEESAFEFGETPLKVEFDSGEAEATIKLYWSSETMAFEPLPAAALFMEDAHPELDLEEHGRQLFATHRCNRCHQLAHDPLSPPGPDLTHIAVGLEAGWLEKWLTGDANSLKHSSMPEFGFTPREVSAVAAFLVQQSQEVTLARTQVKPAQRDDLIEKGKVLFHSLGCLACHEHASKEGPSPFVPLGGGNLSRIGDKRSFGWLEQWLADPAKLNADHRMPVFSLQRDNKSDEILQLATFLSSIKDAAVVGEGGNVSDDQPTFDRESVELGKKLVEAARCAACHRIPGIEFKPDGVPRLDPVKVAGSKGCLQPQPDRSHWRPGYPGADHLAIQAYLATRPETLESEGSHERGRRLLAWNQCLRCHPRDGGLGLGPAAALAGETIDVLRGQSSLLVPPSLNAVGDKMLDTALLKAVAGDFSSPRLPWLRIRMPKFHHTAADRAALATTLIQHDRIESPPAELVALPPTPDGERHLQTLAAGHTLLGSQGFSCIACHSFGKFVPRNTALGTRGSDLRMVGQRMRREFFLRWTRSPIRIVPNMEMPSFERPVEGVLNGRISSQLQALWESLHDENSSRPLEISAVQQNLVVKPGEPARVVRDVFSVMNKRQEVHIARSFAVGFSNRHNVLIDLDTFRLREWWQGDFARQRTEGKSWFWDLGGVRMSTQLGQRPDLALLRGVDGASTLLAPESQNGVCGTLQEYAPEGSGVRLAYQLRFPGLTPETPLVLSVTEILTPLEPAETAKADLDAPGWSRAFTVTGIPDGMRPVILSPGASTVAGSFSVVPLEPTATTWQSQRVTLSDGKVEPLEFSVLKRADGQTVSGTLLYSAPTLIAARETPQPVNLIAEPQSIQTVPGYEAIRLPLPRSIMPTAMTWTKNGTLAVASLKGHVYFVRDSDQDGVEDRLDVFEEGLAAPYGLLADEDGTSLLVSHKPELLRLRDTDGDGRADLRQVVATGWGYNDNYHDWTCGIVRDSQGRLYVGLGSDYTQAKRPRDQQRWRGKILRIDRSGNAEPIASGFRYPTGLAMTPDDELFVTDNQGEQNAFNELNQIIPGERYGVPSIEDKRHPEGSSRRPAIQIPHPWTRSINGIFFLPRDARLADRMPHPFAGHGIGCEYDSRYLIRFSLQKVGDTFQGAVYPLSFDQVPPETPNFEGTLCGGVSPHGDIYIGCIHDSGWLGGLNVGSIFRLRQAGSMPLGIREIQARSDGFSIDFTGPIDSQLAADAKNFTISAYTREWQGDYATPDSQRHNVGIKSAAVSVDRQRVVLQTDKLREGFVYELTCGKIGPQAKMALWPATGHYTVNRVP